MSESNGVWMLLTAGEAGALNVPVKASIGAGVRGEALRRVGLASANTEILESAAVGAQLAYRLLHREKYLDREIEVRFEVDQRLDNVRGRSGDLAFALALIAAICDADGSPRFRWPSLAATGRLDDDGGVEPVRGVAEKAAKAIDVLPPGGLVFLPLGNGAALTPELQDRAQAARVSLVPVSRLEEALQCLGVSLSQTWLEAPFRGLEPFGFGHASIFFGRDPEIEAVLGLLSRRAAAGQGAVLIEGPSGAGKSSLILAGVLPALMRRGAGGLAGDRFRWGLLQARSVEADIDPNRELQSLATALLGAWAHGQAGSLPESGRPAAADADLEPEAQLARLQAWAGTTEPPRFVLVLDQLEQWFDGRLQPATVAALASLASGLVRRGVWLIGGVTSAAAGRLMENQAFAGAFGVEGRFVLDQRLDPARLQAVIDEPAKAARLQFETGLEAQIFSAASHGGTDVLPLLELLLTELYERRDPVARRLKLASYLDVGGLDGVIAARAETAFASCASEAQAMLPALLWRLAVNGEINPADYPADSPAHALVGALLVRRLLVEDRNGAGQRSLRAAHDALLRQWPRAAKAVHDLEADARCWLDLVREAGQWRRGERTLIPRGPQLTAAESLVRGRSADWIPRDQPVLDYVRASAKARDRRRALAWIAAGVGGAALGGVGAKRGYDYLQNLRRIRITFDDIATPPPDYTVAAPSYLKDRGVSVTDVDPPNSRLVIRNSVAQYSGMQVATGASAHFMTQESAPTVAPASFTLRFERPMREVRILRAPLWAATASGVTHPAWIATALDQSGVALSQAGEDLVRSFRPVPPRWISLAEADRKPIWGVKITSDCRLDGQLFAGSEAVLIQEIQLWIA